MSTHWVRTKIILWCCCSWLLAALCLLLQPEPAVTLSSDGHSLLAFKQAIIDELGFLSNWNPSDETPCSWTGVECDNLSQVAVLNLSVMNLTGQVSSLSSLSSLSTLNLSCNSFTGPFPFDGLPATVDTLDISENQFTGKLLRNNGSLSPSSSAMIFFSAHDNNFTGSLPTWLPSWMPLLEFLDLGGSYFTGTIPAEFGNLTKLTVLKLSGNVLEGRIPRELGRLAELKHLELGYNNYSSEPAGFPPEIGMLSKLEYLDLSLTGLRGSIPAEIGNLTQCHTVFLYRNRISGQLPPDMGRMSSLMSLDISDNLLTGPIPTELASLHKLTLLHLMMNSLSGDFPEFLGSLPDLQVLSLWNNSISGSLPSSLGISPALKWIDVSSNLIEGEIPRNICSGGSLIKLELFNNRLTGTIPDVSSCKNLLRSRMHDNRLTGPIPPGFGSMANLTRLELSRNQLSGPIPPEISSAPRLAFVDVSRNQLQGPIPKQLWYLPALQELHAGSNRLSGPVPGEVASARFLGVLDLSWNLLTGPIPEQLAACSKLVKLKLQGNHLSGPIPAQLAELPVLSILDISSNSLRGGIPSDFASSLSLEEFNVSFNNLEGPVPRQGVFATAAGSSFAGNPGLCGIAELPECRSMAAAPNSSRNKRLGQCLMAILFSLTAAALILAAVMYLRHRHKKKPRTQADGQEYPKNNHLDQRPWKMIAYQRVDFGVDEVLARIKEANVVGKGSSGVVYKAEMPSGEVVAVKHLRHRGESQQDRRAFLAEVNVLGRIRHRNIVRLLGYCSNHMNDLLLYEYMPNGSLSDLLHGPSSLLLCEWIERYNIAFGVAQGLAYLHHDCYPQVVHRDVKSSNILLDHNMEARVADFGVAKLMETESMSMVAGSYGYIAPEYAYTLKVREKCDIYSYGVVLLELLTGKRPVSAEFGETGDIVSWLHGKLRTGRLVDVLDPNVGTCEIVQEEMLLVLRLAMLCISRSPRDRPSMRDVVSMLVEAKPRRKDDLELVEVRKAQLSYS